MLGIFAKTFMTATGDRARRHWDPPSRDWLKTELPRHQRAARLRQRGGGTHSWLEEDLPFRDHATNRRGYDD